jgi:hypothetical protein
VTAADDADLRQAAAAIMTMGVSVTDVVTRLAKATPQSEIKHKPGPHSKRCEKPCNVTHTPLDYIDARYVMDTLDEGVGPDNWQTRHTMGDGGKVSCSIGIRIDGEWIWKSDGAGETDIEGEKGSFSDSLKRAAVSWGIARDLYDNDRPAAAPAVRTTTPRTTEREPLYDGFEGQDDEHFRPTQPARPRAAVSDADGSCPDHGPWTLKPGGISKKTGAAYDPFYACGFRPERGQPFCNNKPSKAWLARQEV